MRCEPRTKRSRSSSAEAIRGISGRVRLTDNPARGRGRAVIVERGLEEDGYAALLALVDDYIEQAERHDEIPMLVSLLKEHLLH